MLRTSFSGRSGLIEGRNSSVSSEGKRGFGPSLKPLFVRARAGKGTQASPSVAPALRQRVNPTASAASREHRPWTGLSGVKHSFRSGVLIVAHQQAKPFRGQPFKPLEIEHSN